MPLVPDLQNAKTNLRRLITSLSWAANKMLKTSGSQSLSVTSREGTCGPQKWTHLSIVLVRASPEIGPELNIQVQFVSDMQQKLSKYKGRKANQVRRKATKDGLPIQQPLYAPGG